MERQAEFNRFCNVPLLFTHTFGLLGTNSHLRSKHVYYGTDTEAFHYPNKALASMIEREATTLFKNYNVCSPVTSRTKSWLAAVPEAEDMVKKIPECPAFEADCCLFHIFYNVLQNLRSDIELACGKNLTLFVDGNINQLHVALSERAALYTCKNEDLPQMDPGQVQEMKTAQKKMYIWVVLQKYEQFMQNTTKRYSNVIHQGKK